MILRLAVALLFSLAACSDQPLPRTCSGLAAPACPADDDADVCSDVACASVYACDDGQWAFVRNCPNSPLDGGSSRTEASAESGIAVDASVDAPPGAYGGPGCADLQTPDCSLGTALACAPATACCGCQDLYVCAAGGWNLWGECVDGRIAAIDP